MANTDPNKKVITLENIQPILTKIKSYFVKQEEGKGLSTNDFTNEYKDKINNVDSSVKQAEESAKKASESATNAQNTVAEVNQSIEEINKKIEDLGNISNIEFTEDGKISGDQLQPASKENLGAIKIGEEFEISEDGTLNLKAGSTTEEILYSNSTPTVSALGGISVGETFEKVKITDMFTKLLYPYVAPTVSTSIVIPSNGGVFEKGNIQTITSVNVNITKKSSDIIKVELYNGSILIAAKEKSELSEVNTGGLKTVNFVISTEISSDLRLTAKVTDSENKVTSANTGAFSFVYPYYYGVIDSSAEINEVIIKSLTKLIQAKGTKSQTYTANNQKILFISPVSYGIIKTITDPNGFNVTDTFKQSTLSITGLDGTQQDYYVYESEATTVNNFKMTFAY